MGIEGTAVIERSFTVGIRRADGELTTLTVASGRANARLLLDSIVVAASKVGATVLTPQRTPDLSLPQDAALPWFAIWGLHKATGAVYAASVLNRESNPGAEGNWTTTTPWSTDDRREFLVRELGAKTAERVERGVTPLPLSKYDYASAADAFISAVNCLVPGGSVHFSSNVDVSGRRRPVS